MSKPTKFEADQLVVATKVVSSSVSWVPKSKNSWRVEAKALAPALKQVFRLVGYIGRHNHSFALLYKNYPIRKYTKHSKHKFQDKVVLEPHKHLWDEYTEDKEVYIPDDIDPESDLNDQFLAFCQECNINLVGGYQRAVHRFK